MSRGWIIGVLAGIAALLLSGIVAYLYLQQGLSVTPVVPVAATNTNPVRRVIGTSVEGRAIEAFTYGAGTRHVLFVGGVHGGYEWNSVVLAYAFLDYFKDSPELIPASMSVTVIPSLNPDGVYAVLGKEGRIEKSDVVAGVDLSAGRFNAHEVDLNRNFDCKWKPESAWRSKTVSAGVEAFSEPEARALRDLVSTVKPEVVVFWHSQANAVYASECLDGILPKTLESMRAYARAAEYPAVESFDSYPVTGDAEGWLASIGIPAITVELSTHDDIEWERNLRGVRALLESVVQSR